MNFLKSIFIVPYLLMGAGLAVHAVWSFGHGGSAAGSIGVLLATAPSVTAIGWWMLFRTHSRTSARLPLLNVLGLAGVCLASVSWMAGEVGAGIVGQAIAGWLGFIAYSHWYSLLERRPSESLRVGRQLPTFAVKDVSGALVSSIQMRGRPTVFLFYRGNWCPLCMAQVTELAGRYRDLESLGVQVALVSPQPHANTVKLAKRMGVQFGFYTDEGNRAARMLGIDSRDGLPMGMQMMGYDSETVLPTVIITDRDGRVVWVHETDNYRVRPEPDLFLQVLAQHGVS
jgi:peroxiredoxin